MAATTRNGRTSRSSRVRTAFQDAGLIGALRYALDSVIVRALHLRRKLSPRYWRREREEGFDRRFGTETSSTVSVYARADRAFREEFRHAQYRPADVRVVKALLDRLDIPHEQFVFVDYGSGKGRVLLVASDYPFDKIIGVEIYRDLHEIAQRNVANYVSPVQRCHEIELVCADAQAYEPPRQDSVFFFYEPFAEPVAMKVLARMERSLREHPRRMLVVAVGVNAERLLAQIASARCLYGADVEVHRRAAIYELVPARIT